MPAPHRPAHRPLWPSAALSWLACGIVLAAVVASAPAARAGSAGPTAVKPATFRLTTASPTGIHAVAAELADPVTGKTLWSRRKFAEFPIASLTKVMTALIVIRADHLNTRITITQADVDYVLAYGTSSAGLYVGDVLTARQLLYAMLLPSGADAAAALADRYGPGWPAFIRKMNALAARLGLHRTHFSTFDGIFDTDESTPRNLLGLGEAAMRLPAFRAVVKRRSYWLPAGPHHHSYLWRNTNLLLGGYPGLIGIKTGWTPDAGECLLFEATHGTHVLIGIVLNSAPTKTGASFADAARMLNWGFALRRPVALPRFSGPVPAG